jgi:TPR repeat protein
LAALASRWRGGFIRLAWRSTSFSKTAENQGRGHPHPQMNAPAASLRARRFSNSPWVARFSAGAALYILSIGPALRFGNGPFQMSPTAMFIYQPLGAIMNCSPYAAAVVTWYVRLWGVKVDPHPLSIERSGSAAEQYDLARSYESTPNSPQMAEKALLLFRRAAEKKHAPAQLALSQHYRFGIGVDADPVQALMWWLLALENGDASFRLRMGQCDIPTTPAERAKAEKLAREMSSKLARQAGPPPRE